MKCRECECCHKGWFESKPDAYVCIGVKEPFVINNINHEYTEYPEYRSKEVSIEDSLIVTYDSCPPDVSTLIVAKKDKYDMTMLNQFQGDEAFGIYHLLTGGAELMQKHGHWYTLTDCSNAGTYCSVCHKKVYKEHYANVKEKSKFCPNCGAIMDEKFRIL